MSEEFSIKFSYFQDSVKSCALCGSRRGEVTLNQVNGEVPLLLLFDKPVSEDSVGYKLLEDLMISYGLEHKDYQISSIIKCSNIDVSQENSRNCRKHLAQEFRLLRPKIICLLGSGAHEAFFGVRPEGNKVRGVFKEINGFEIVTTCNPNLCVDKLPLKLCLFEDIGNVKKRLKEKLLIN